MDLEQPASSNLGDTTLKRLRLRYAGKCVLCGSELAKGTGALDHLPTKKLVDGGQLLDAVNVERLSRNTRDRLSCEVATCGAI